MSNVVSKKPGDKVTIGNKWVVKIDLNRNLTPKL